MSRNRKHLYLAIVILVLAGLACQISGVTGLSPTGEAGPAPESRSSTVVTPGGELAPAEPIGESPPPAPDLVSQQDRLVALYESVSPGVVSIRTGGGQGSGFVVDSNGHVVTNFHVVQDALSIEVNFPSGYKTRGDVIGTDPDSDLAVIQVDAPLEELHPLVLGDSSQARVGQTVVAIGNPFGLDGTMTVGIISALGRTLDSLREAPNSNQFFTAGDIIQTDAAINPGNSGGPLLNLNGEVVGVNRAIRTENFDVTGSPLNTGIGFAIPVNIVKRVVPHLIEQGFYSYPYLGVTSISELSLAVQEQLGLPQATGAYVSEVAPGGPADRGGLRSGDLIVRIDGQPVHVFGDLLSYLLTQKSPGDSVVLEVLRGDQQLELTVVLGERP